MKKLLLAGALLCSAGLASALLLPVGNETVLTTREATQENLLPVSGFDDADFSQTFTSGVFNQWTVHKAADESSAVDIALVDDAERGQVASYTGKPNSWYTSFIAQRIEGEFVPGIYRLTGPRATTAARPRCSSARPMLRAKTSNASLSRRQAAQRTCRRSTTAATTTPR